MKHHLEKFLQIGLQVLLFFLPWQTVWLYREPVLNGFKWQFGTLGLYGVELLVFFCTVLFVVWFFLRLKSQKEKIIFHWSRDRLLLLSILIFSLYSFLSLWWSDDPALGLQQALRLIEAGLFFLMILLGPLSPRQITTAFSLGLVWPVCLGIWQFLSQSTFASAWLGLSLHPAEELGTAVVQSGEFRYLRAYGTFAHPNIFGGYVVIGLLFTVMRILSEKTFSFRTLWWHGLFLLEVMALFFTFSRAAWIGGIIVLVGYLWLVGQTRLQIQHNTVQRITPFLVVIFITILGWLYTPLVLNRFSVATSTEARSVSERISGYQEALTLFHMQPWFGVGVGGYTAQLHELHHEAPGFVLQPVHNTGLLILVEFGIVGLFLLGCIFFCLWRFLREKMGKGRVVMVFGLCFSPLFPLFLWDHYLMTSLSVLFASVILWGVVIRCFYTDFPHFVHFFPQKFQNWLS